MKKKDFQLAPWKNLKLQIPGRHNQLNANAVLAATQALQLNQKGVESALEGYQGAERRFQIWGERQGAIIIDDYAHHPREIEVTLRAAREKFPQKSLTVVFHPHTFTRTEAFLEEFARSFGDCDQLILLDIYGSAREKKGTVHARDLAEEIQKSTRRPSEIIQLADIDQAFENLKNRLNSNQVLITMGAGDVWKLAEKLVKL
jgi:UDP-N-acetylmuramate--alanine ligase